MPTLLKMRVPPPTDWNEFEDITRSALRVKWRRSDMQKNGRQGQEQAGVDVFGHDDLSRWVGVQCRKKDNAALTIKEVLQAITDAEQFKPPLDAFYMATTLSRDAKLQLEIRLISERRTPEKKFAIGVFFWEDLYEDLVGDTAEFGKHYPQLVPQQTAAPQPSPLVSPTALPPIPTDPAQKQYFRAGQEVYALAHDLTARLNTHPDTEWGEVCEMIALNFGGYERQLTDLIRDYGVVLDDGVLGLLKEACGIATNGKHHVHFSDDDGPIVDHDGRKMADALHSVLEKAATEARQKLRERAGLAERR